MIILKVMGGFGNQMFQYALARELLYRGKTVKADISYYHNIPLGDTQRSSIKELLFDDLPIASNEEVQMFLYENEKLQWKIVRRIVPNFYKAPVYLQRESYEYQDKLFHRENVYAVGWWQTEQYFMHVKDLVRMEYLKNIKILGEKNRSISEEIQSHKHSISVHVRGGDYHSPANKKVFGGICGREYYHRAFNFFEKQFEDCVFYIFTNDIEYARQILPMGKNYKLIENREDEGAQDIILMSQCKCHIIANSTFSWWGAWLNPKMDKIVISPVQWNHKVKTTPNCDGWITM